MGGVEFLNVVSQLLLHRIGDVADLGIELGARTDIAGGTSAEDPVEGISVAAANLPKIRDAMTALKPGAPFKVTILRAGQVLELTGKVP